MRRTVTAGNTGCRRFLSAGTQGSGLCRRNAGCCTGVRCHEIGLNFCGSLRTVCFSLTWRSEYAKIKMFKTA